LSARALRDRLDDEVRVGEVPVLEGGRDASARGVGVGLLDAALLDRPRQLLLDPADAAVEPVLIDLADDDLEPRLGRYLRDAMTHQAAAEHADLADVGHVSSRRRRR
jgi:hypothetical protein